MVDYTKWNKFARDQSDSDEEDSSPRVTKLESDTKIQIGPQGTKFCKASPSEDNLTQPSKLVASNIESCQNELNSTQYEKCSWKQNRYEVEMIAILPIETRASEVSLSYEESDRQLIINIGHTPYLAGKLYYPIKSTKVEEFDWEVKTEAQLRKLHITFEKMSPIPNATIWWKALFQGDPEIDVTKIKGRNIPQNSLWEEAHNAFKEKIANFERIEIAEDTDA